jgi:hypothetical protein
MTYDDIAWSLAIVCRRNTLPNLGMLGTCFSLFESKYFVTAAHCVVGVPREELILSGLGLLSNRVPVARLIVHPTADIAILEAELPAEHYVQPLLMGAEPPSSWGAHVVSFGFPADRSYLGQPENYVEMNGPTLRFFRGHIQTGGLHVSHDDFKYDALELSFMAPNGLSGGPVFLDGNENPIALVAENHESSTFIRTICESDEHGREFRETVHAVVNYAIAVKLARLKDWLIEQMENAQPAP